MKKIAILGSTGSIGTQTLEVVRENGDIEVLGLAARRNIKMLEEQIREFHPQIVAVWSEEKAEELRVNVADTSTKIVAGMDGLIEVATMAGTEILVTAVVGMIGIRPTIEAIKAGKISHLPIRRHWLQRDILLCRWQKRKEYRSFR